MPAHWAINGRFLGQPITGVQRYAHEILQSLDAILAEGRNGPEVSVEVLMPQGIKPPGLRAISARNIGPLQGHAWEQFTLPVHARNGLISLCNTGPISKRRQILCVHDLNTRLYPQSYSRSFRLLYHTLIPALAWRVNQLVTVSHYSASELERLGLSPADAVAILPNGHEHTQRWTPAHTAATRAAAGPDTIVLLGSRAAHKNIGLILGLAPWFREHGFRIALVGSANAQIFAGCGMSAAAENVIELGRIGDNALAALLQDSLCLAFPSFVEGFGSPPLEAMSLGCPVVVSDRASLPEVCGGAALYAAPDDPDAWMHAFLRLRHEPGLRNAMSTAGKVQAQAFSWRSSAAYYLELMAAMDARSTSSSAAETEPAVIA